MHPNTVKNSTVLKVAGRYNPRGPNHGVLYMAVKSQSTLAPLAKSKLKARSAAKGLSVAELEKVIANLAAALDMEKKKENQKAEAAKKASIAKIKALMDETGLAPEDLKASGRSRRGKAKAKAKGKAKRSVEPKYRLVIDGEEHLWSGRGRPPRAFKEYMDAGNSKESCAI
jgi:DNA-binding protein H-NS